MSEYLFKFHFLANEDVCNNIIIHSSDFILWTNWGFCTIILWDPKTGYAEIVWFSKFWRDTLNNCVFFANTDSKTGTFTCKLCLLIGPWKDIDAVADIRCNGQYNMNLAFVLFKKIRFWLAAVHQPGYYSLPTYCDPFFWSWTRF